MRHTAFSYRLCPDAETDILMRRHAGASRFAYNHCVGIFLKGRERWLEGHREKGPTSGMDFINVFNGWKISADAGIENGRPGLPWRHDIHARVFEEACVDAGRSVAAFFKACKMAKARGKARLKAKAGSRGEYRKPGSKANAAKKAGGGGKCRKPRSWLPRFKKKNKSPPRFRMRNEKDAIKLGVSSIRLPKLGDIPVAHSTRTLRRMLRPREDGKPRARILFATLTRTCGAWYVRLNVEAEAFHPEMRVKASDAAHGVDFGIKSLAVVANSQGKETGRQPGVKALKASLRRLKCRSREMSHKKEGSRNRIKARLRLAKLHHRIANMRNADIHKLTHDLAKTHGHVALEDLYVSGMLRNRRLARHISDAGWGKLRRTLEYKSAWYNCQVTVIDRFAPSSKTCCKCDWKNEELTLDVRTFRCSKCSWEADRDVNAAANLARWAEQKKHVRRGQADVETKNACQEQGRRSPLKAPLRTG